MYRKLVQSRTLVFLFFILIFLYPSVALAQSFSLDLGDGPSSTGRIIQLFLLITVLSLAPSILVMMDISELNLFEIDREIILSR